MEERYEIPDFLRRHPEQPVGPRERPILFSAPMICAILSGTKTQTRRVVKLPANAKHVQYWTPPSGKSEPGWADPGVNYWTPDPSGETDSNHLDRCPYGHPGNRLWVREAFMHEPADYCWEASVSIPSRPAVTTYRADFEGDTRGAGWKPSIHMPRALSRILLEITAVRVERLNDISADDSWAEGIPHSPDVNPIHEYAALWESINGPGSWAANPWVWVVEFRRLP